MGHHSYVGNLHGFIARYYVNPTNTVSGWARRMWKRLCSEWWRHQMETFSALLAFSPVTGDFSTQTPVTRSFDVFFDLHLNQQLSKQWRRRWFETPSNSLWRHCNGFHFLTNLFIMYINWQSWYKTLCLVNHTLVSLLVHIIFNTPNFHMTYCVNCR